MKDQKNKDMEIRTIFPFLMPHLIFCCFGFKHFLFIEFSQSSINHLSDLILKVDWRMSLFVN